METLPTMVDPLTTDLSSLELPIPVTLATPSMETPPPGIVRVVEAGMGQLQYVSVSGLYTYKVKFIIIIC